MRFDTFDRWIDELRKQHFNISAASWRLLKLAGQYERTEVSSTESTLEVTTNGLQSTAYSVEYATGKLRMVLARIASLYLDGEMISDRKALYGFSGTMEVKDNFGVSRSLEIGMKNNQKEGFRLTIKSLKC